MLYPLSYGGLPCFKAYFWLDQDGPESFWDNPRTTTPAIAPGVEHKAQIMKGSMTERRRASGDSTSSSVTTR